MYTVAVSKKLTKADIDAFVETNPTATVTFVAKTADMCSNPTVTTVSWEACGSCKISKEAYEITLPDDECGNSAKKNCRQHSRILQLKIMAHLVDVSISLKPL